VDTPFDPSDPFAVPDTPAGLVSLTINRLMVDALGARIDAEGAVDYADGPAGRIFGIALPQAYLSLEANGLYGLVDALGDLGLIGAGRILQARMALGALTVPGDGPDTLRSELEITAEGRIIANGLPFEF